MLHNYIKHCRVLHIKGDEKAVFAALEEEAGIFGDNGGDPDGFLWLADAGVSRKNLEAALETGEAEVVSGYVIRNYRALASSWKDIPEATKDFCGYSSADVAYAIDADIAQALALEIEYAQVAALDA